MKRKTVNHLKIQFHCKPTGHHFQAIDVTPRMNYAPQQLGVMGGYGPVTPQYKLFCIKCGEDRAL